MYLKTYRKYKHYIVLIFAGFWSFIKIVSYIPFSSTLGVWVCFFFQSYFWCLPIVIELYFIHFHAVCSCINMPELIYSPVDKHLSYFFFFAITENTIANFLVYICRHVMSFPRVYNQEWNEHWKFLNAFNADLFMQNFFTLMHSNSSLSFMVSAVSYQISFFF